MNDQLRMLALRKQLSIAKCDLHRLELQHGMRRSTAWRVLTSAIATVKTLSALARLTRAFLHS